jgi:hypothetical protein|mmetsp:Transcript_15989/g.28852  ORF Transcript_15989/g.28852 Transcript_15989/m.28852 type:complete len:113 (+) Transcript_15989:88-426(+)
MQSSRSSTLLFVLLCLSLVSSSFGFAASPPNCSSVSSNTRLHQSSIPDQQHPAWFDLPSAKTSRDNVVGVQAAEDVVGRIAMVSALALTVGEVVTGESVTEQVIDALHSLLS